MNYPLVEIYIEKIRHNAGYLVDFCSKHNIEVMGVSKGVCAMTPVVNAMLQAGIKKLGDSRIQNIISMRQNSLNCPIYLIRIPMLSEVAEVVRWADGSLNSEIDVIKALSQESVIQGKKHRVILMVDVGDLREGVMPEDVLDMVGKILGLPGVEFEGLGTNLGCYGGILASYENTKVLVDLAGDIEKRYGIKVKTLSGGNTATLKLLEKGGLAPGINQFRIGEAILLGTDVTNFRKVPGTLQDTMVLKTEVIEVKVKPSSPIGEIGRDAFGNIPVFVDKGPMKRAIVALGKQDCRIEGLTPVDETMEILGGSSDHLLVDVTNSRNIQVGSIIQFRMSYGAMLSLMTSEYVGKKIV
ncbi:MAG: ornithine racemase [Thermoanaerobacteraceae bacterium]|jgi:predicted amino acid racemase|uniref:Alanine/ornithine racemase family PLP-dependent enzyme n=1 Tax=Biomaibacter acetigenes TaxID=2316383 RepID=A0A3G2R6G7_9FIRM|nr:alanine/ornithine racemase family PLP-dependent enzyme [Biomaibacter acetigenes]MDK2877338.1 ornithine racemase [Thermoanaerobacteraceae bacterium]RKL63881.1 alanine/ornithine racemase family PLP-dependent enzyme [Thermoanaerobacteraceae bacterium SP2]AYO31042.1 alanine/ornithine racemase family PLP-dependent enzyme [Biomaibacter acetigenes]MDN5301965.1 ornithine racemase [Thermoanaerobacteraceae bacterium]MDN5311951.1 ornithine racemase [Thermoanaerobacteraceae bacterium]